MLLHKKLTTIGPGGFKCFCCKPGTAKHKRQVKRCAEKRAKYFDLKERKEDLN